MIAGRAAVAGPLRLAAVLSVAVASLSIPAAARAVGPVFALQVTGSRAPYFVLAGRPRHALDGEVTVINVGGSAGGVSLYPTDATTGQTSGAVYRSPQEPRRDVGAWIRLANRHLRLGPGQADVIPFRVLVPANVRAGQHLGGIVAQPDQPLARIAHRRGKATFHVQVRSIAVIAVELNLPGPRIQHLDITGMRAGTEPGYQTLLLGLTSSGTALTKGSGTVTVTDEEGRERFNHSFTLDTLVPHTHIDYPLQVTGRALPAGNYHAAIEISYGNHTLGRTVPFRITAKDLSEVFTSHQTRAPSSAGGSSMILFVIAGAALLLVGFAVGARARTSGSATS